MRPTHIEHIGIAVRSLDAAIPRFAALLGIECSGIEEVRDQNVRTAFFQVGQSKIELLEPIGPDGPIASFLEKRGEGIHHVAFAVDDITEALRDAAQNGFQMIDTTPRPGAEGLLIAFLHPRSTHGVLTELCAKPGSTP